MNDIIPQPRRRERPPVRADEGGWISGPSADPAAPVEAGHVHPGDVLVIDGTLARVTDVRHGDYWLSGGRAAGVSIGWHAVSATASGVLFRRADEIVHRLAGDGTDG